MMSSNDNFKARQSLDLEAKIEMTKNRIRVWYDHWDGDVFIGYSGGKDSHVLCDIVWSMGGKYRKIPMVLSNTGLEMPEILKHVRKQRGKGWNIVETRPEKTYQQVWQEEGIPLVSKRVAKAIRVLSEGDNGNNSNMYRLFNEGVNRNGVPAPNWKIPNKWRFLVGKVKTTEKCCDALKKDPLRAYKKITGEKAITGMMADEGGYRRNKTQCNMYDAKEPSSSPMLFWLESDIWEYIESKGIEICHVYYNRVYNEDAELVACDSPFSDLPSLDEFFLKNNHLVCTKHDTVTGGGYADFGTYAIFKEWGDIKKDYAYISGEKRTGCMFCAFGAHLEKGSNRFQRMSISHPRQHKLIMDRIGMREPLGMIGVKVDFDD